MKNFKVINTLLPLIYAVIAMILFACLVELTFFVSYQILELSQQGHGALSMQKTLLNLIFDGLLVISVLAAYKWLNIPSVKKLGFRFDKISGRVILVSLGIISIQYLLIIVLSATTGTIWSLGTIDLPSLLRAIILMLGVGVGEEVFFRAGVFNILRPLGRKPAYIVGGLIFALAHFFGEPFDVLRLLGTFLPGLLFIYVYEQTESIWAGSIIHAAMNLFSLLIIHQITGISLTSFSGNENFVVVIWTISYTLTLIAIAYYVKKTKLRV